MTMGPQDGSKSRISPWKFVLLTSILMLVLVSAVSLLMHRVSSNDADEHAWRELRTLTHETAYVYSVAFSPNGKWLATAAENDVKLWTTDPIELETVLTGHRDSVRSLSFSPDSSVLASSSDDASVRLWELDSGRQLAMFAEHTANVNCVSFAPDGTTLASASDDGIVILWDAAAHKELRKFVHTSGVNSVRFSSDGKTLATGSDNCEVLQWSLESGSTSIVLGRHSEAVWSIAYSPDGTLLATAGDDGSIQFWNTKTGTLVTSMSEPAEDIWSLEFSPDGSLLAIGMGGSNTGLSLLGQLLGFGDSEAYTGTLALWDVSRQKKVESARGHRDWIRSVSFTADGRKLASGSDDGTVKLWANPQDRTRE